jgi:hypothetical protein
VVLTLKEARDLVEEFLDSEMRVRFPHEIVIVDEGVRDQGNAWVFPYDGRGYIERGDFDEMMLGNVPLMVDKNTGVVKFVR